MPPSANPCPVDYGVQMTHPGEYTIAFTTVTCGPHLLKVKLGDVEIQGSPFPVWIDMRVRKAHVCEHESSSVQMECDGVSVGRKCILTVAQDTVYVLHKNGRTIDQIRLKWSGITKFEADCIDITRGDTHAILTSSKLHHVVKMNLAERKVVKWVGRRGAAPLQFDHPSAVHVHPSGNILVADSGNHRIQVLNQDLSFSHMLGSGTHNSGHGEFGNPSGITTDRRGMVYVVDRGNQCIQKLTLEGEFVTQFPTVDPPRSITYNVSSNVVYVSCNKKSDNKAVVQVFGTDGHFLGNLFTHTDNFGVNMDYYNKIAVDASAGRLWITTNNYLETYNIHNLLDQLIFS